MGREKRVGKVHGSAVEHLVACVRPWPGPTQKEGEKGEKRGGRLKQACAKARSYISFQSLPREDHGNLGL